jgi:hypothetical protein
VTPTVIVAIALIVAVLISSPTLLRSMFRGGALSLAAGGPHPHAEDAEG